MSDNQHIAVSQEAYNQWGCPHCGYRSAFQSMSAGGVAVLQCADSDCRRGFLIFAEGVTVSSIGLGGDGETVYPKLQPHPRAGTPSHGSPDKRPEEGGEYFYSRGIGSDRVNCFVCGVDCYSNIAAFVQCKASGERVVAMFGKGAWMDYRESEPDRIQVKVGACKEHFSALEKLHKITEDGRITAERIKEAREK